MDVTARPVMLRTLIVAALAAATLACGTRKPAGPVVARGKDVAVTAEQLRASLAELSPYDRSQYRTPERKKELVENLVRTQLLLAEARRRKLDQDPEVRAALERLMVQRLVRTAFEEGAKAEAPTEDEARAYYRDHLEEYVKPERVRASLVFLRAEAGSAQRAARTAEARGRLEQLRKEEPRNPLAFGNLARDASDDQASKAAGGDVGLHTFAELEASYGKPVAEAAFALQEPGSVSGVVEAPAGLYLVKLGARQKALSRSFDEVRGQLVTRLERERKGKGFDAFVAKLRRDAEVEIVDTELEKVDVAAPAPGPGAPRKP